jgi:hypothetical protein
VGCGAVTGAPVSWDVIVCRFHWQALIPRVNSVSDVDRRRQKSRFLAASQTQSGDMGRLRTLARTFRDFATNHVEEPGEPAAPDGSDGYTKSTKIALLLFKEEVNKLLRQFEDYLNEMPGILAVFSSFNYNQYPPRSGPQTKLP